MRNFIIAMLYNTKEIKDNKDMKIVHCIMKQVEENIYNANGFIAAELSEHRHFNSYITFSGDDISIRSEIVKLMSKDANKEYVEYTFFKKTGEDMYHRQTKYSYIDKCFEDDIVVDNYDIIYQDYKDNIKGKK